MSVVFHLERGTDCLGVYEQHGVLPFTLTLLTNHKRVSDYKTGHEKCCDKQTVFIGSSEGESVSSLLGDIYGGGVTEHVHDRLYHMHCN